MSIRAYTCPVSSDETPPSGRRNLTTVTYQRIGPWVVKTSWPSSEDQLGPVQIELSPSPEATEGDLLVGLSSTVLRKIDFRQARDEWRQIQDETRQKKLMPMQETWRTERLRQLLEVDGVREPYLAQLAETYIGMVMFGDTAVSDTLAEMTGRSRDTVRQHLHRARKAGMLTSVAGKAGGEITDKAVEVLLQSSQDIPFKTDGNGRFVLKT